MAAPTHAFRSAVKSGTVLDRVVVPVVLAPLAGGPSTPELAAAVSDAGGLGFLAGGYLSAEELRRRTERTRALTPAPIGVNLFVPGPGPTDPERYAKFSARFREWARERGVAVGEPRYSDDDWEAKLALLRELAPEVVSFTFGCPTGELLARLRAVGAEVWVTVTTPEEAVRAAAAGAQALACKAPRPAVTERRLPIGRATRCTDCCPCWPWCVPTCRCRSSPAVGSPLPRRWAG